MSVILIDEDGTPSVAPPYNPADDLIVDHTISVVGDLHWGLTDVDRMNTAARALRMMNGSFAARIYAGDMTDNGYTAEWTLALAYADSISTPWYTVAGNHDYNGSGTEASFLAASGKTPTWTLDLPNAPIRIIGISPASMGSPSEPFGVFTTAMLNTIDAASSGTTRECVVVTHTPLKNSVDEAGKTWAFYYSDPDADIRAMLADNPNIRAWVSGHTHSSLAAIGLVKEMPTATGKVIAINASSPSSSPVKPGTIAQNNISPYISIFEDRLEVRYHDHKSGMWASYAGQKVHTFWNPQG